MSVETTQKVFDFVIRASSGFNHGDLQQEKKYSEVLVVTDKKIALQWVKVVLKIM